MELLPEQTFPANEDLDKPNKDYTDLLHLNLDENNREIQKRLTSNATDIATNVTDIATNTTDIAAVGFVDRGDPSAVDLRETNGDFSDIGNTAGVWYEFNLNTIAGVPKTAKAVLLVVALTDNAVNSLFFVRDSANSNDRNISRLGTILDSIAIVADLVTPITDGKIDIKTGSVNFSDFTEILLTVKGWWL